MEKVLFDGWKGAVGKAWQKREAAGPIVSLSPYLRAFTPV